jgi:hypothetical protein
MSLHAVSVKPFAKGGAWSGTNPETFNNVWIAAYLAKTVYKGLGSIISETDRDFEKRFCKEMTDLNGAKNCT